jgi:hypothetical protein
MTDLGASGKFGPEHLGVDVMLDQFTESNKQDHGINTSAAFMDAYGLRTNKQEVKSSDEQLLIQKLTFAGAVYDHSNRQAGMDREYGKPSPARQEFNEAFAEFRGLQATHTEKEAFAKVKDKMLVAIDDADKYSESTQEIFYDNINSSHKSADSKPAKDVIDKLQLLSSALQSVTPGVREDLMRGLTRGDLSKLNQFDEVKAAYAAVDKQFAANGVNALLKSWFDYRAGLGDSIGQRQVFIGLSNRFDNGNGVAQHEQKIQEFKDRVGGKYLY